MNYHYDNQDEAHRVAEARDSYSARLLTNGQFEEALANTHIIEREIRRSGSFKEKLGDYAHAFARMQGFDTMKGEASGGPPCLTGTRHRHASCPLIGTGTRQCWRPAI